MEATVAGGRAAAAADHHDLARVHLRRACRSRIALGAGANARHSIGTGIIGGMIGETTLAMLYVPLFFYLFDRLDGAASEREGSGAARMRSRGRHARHRRRADGRAPAHALTARSGARDMRADIARMRSPLVAFVLSPAA